MYGHFPIMYVIYKVLNECNSLLYLIDELIRVLRIIKINFVKIFIIMFVILAGAYAACTNNL
jgi:hypothetical protein